MPVILSANLPRNTHLTKIAISRMSLFAPLGGRIQNLKLPRYMRFDSPSPTRHHRRSTNVAACGRCSRPSSVPSRLQPTRMVRNTNPQPNIPINFRKKVPFWMLLSRIRVHI